MREKIALFCNLNEITGVEHYQGFADSIIDSSYISCVAYNTNDFLIQGIRDLYKGTIDDEQFFQIGDITSEIIIKIPRPHIDAVDHILRNIADKTIYVIDQAAKHAYTHVHGSRDVVTQKLHEKGSAIYPI